MTLRQRFPHATDEQIRLLRKGYKEINAERHERGDNPLERLMKQRPNKRGADYIGRRSTVN